MVSSFFYVVIYLIVYVDVLVILNTLVNYFILLAIRSITHSYTKRWRIVLGAFIGGISSLLLFLEYLSIIMTMLKVLSGVVMIAATFGIKPIKQFFKNFFFLFAITFLFGGVTYAIYIFFDKDILIYSNGIIYFDVDITFLVICSVVSYIVITLIARFTDKKSPRQKEYYVTVENNGKTFSCLGLMDTGNNLREPFSDYPVVMADKAIFNRVYSNESIRVIPVSTVNGESIIRAFKPQKITIGSFTTDKVYIGESAVALDEYKIILNINLEGEMNND